LLSNDYFPKRFCGCEEEEVERKEG
jgi:hypothetical protein